MNFNTKYPKDVTLPTTFEMYQLFLSYLAFTYHKMRAHLSDMCTIYPIEQN